MKPFIKYTIYAASLGTMLFVLAVALGASASRRSTLKCTRLSVTIKDSLENSFISKSDIKGFLDSEAGGYIGKLADSIDLKKIEKIIDSRSAVLKSEAYITKNGTLNIDVTQRRPILRFQKAGGGFYADAEGFLFPLQSSYAAYVPVIDGAIPLNAESGYKGRISDEKGRIWLEKIIRLTEYMDDSKVWRENIVQITVSGNGDLIMVPREGKEKFIFGSPDKPEEKFRRMEKYYESIVPARGEGQYRTVNVKFDNQIICRK